MYRLFLAISLALIGVYLLVVVPVHATPVRPQRPVRWSYSCNSSRMARAECPGNIGISKSLGEPQPQLGMAVAKVVLTMIRNEKPGADGTGLREVADLRNEVRVRRSSSCINAATCTWPPSSASPRVGGNVGCIQRTSDHDCRPILCEEEQG
jgi:hypothetical protein